MDDGMEGLMNGMNGWIDGRMVAMVEWFDGCKNGYDGWMDGWTN